MWSYLHLTIRINDAWGFLTHTIIIRLREDNITVRRRMGNARSLRSESISIVIVHTAWTLCIYSIRKTVSRLRLRRCERRCIKSVAGKCPCLYLRWWICWSIIVVEWNWTIIIIVIIIIAIETIIDRSRMLDERNKRRKWMVFLQCEFIYLFPFVRLQHFTVKFMQTIPLKW